MKLKSGSWHKFSDHEKEIWIESGTVLGSGSSINQNSSICNPIHLSGNSKIHHGCRVDKYVKINWDVILFPNVHVGAYSSIARNVQIGAANHPTNWLSTNSFQYNSANFPKDEGYMSVNKKRHLPHPKTNIGADVWIGTNVIVTSGVEIGHGAIVAGGAVVVSDVEPYAIVGGVPAKFIKKRFSEETINKLLELKWWLLPISLLQNIDFDNIDLAICQLEDIKGGVTENA
ncbi:MAG: hypothetical protein RPS47_15755 [Colwellia sp.]|jgi:Acetyltransferase (isoleucine patch superfamily)